MNGSERRAYTGWLAVPMLAAVDGVPDDTFIAGRPPFAVVDELDRVQSGVLEIAQVRSPTSGQDGSAGQNGDQAAWHGFLLNSISGEKLVSPLLVKQPIPNDAVESVERVAEAYFLPLFIGSPGVA